MTFVTVLGWIGAAMRGLASRIEALFQGLLGSGATEGTVASAERSSSQVPSVAAVSGRMCQEVERHALDWGFGETMYPNHVEVLVGCDAWNDCFGPMVHACRQRLERILDEYVQERGRAAGAWEVVMGVDPVLANDAVSVRVSFAADAGQTEPTMRMAHEADDKTVRAAAPVASATVRVANREHGVHAGSTIGRSRYTGREAPSVDLRGERGFDLVSHVHGRFDYSEAQGWTFTSVGRNGTKLVHGGAVRSLAAQTAYPLTDGDVLRFGDDHSQVTFACA